jgi:hypothetical protein
MVLCNYNRDVTSAIALDINAMASDLDLKTWGFLIYPDYNEERENSLENLMRHILFNGVMPFSWHFF